MRPTEKPGSDSFNNLLLSTLSGLVEIMISHGRMLERIESGQQTALAQGPTTITLLTTNKGILERESIPASQRASFQSVRHTGG
jgi:hypothetical protein